MITVYLLGAALAGFALYPCFDRRRELICWIEGGHRKLFFWNGEKRGPWSCKQCDVRGWDK